MKKFLRAALPAALAGLVLLSLASQLSQGHGEHGPAPWWESVPGLFALFGFLGCLALIFTALGLGSAFLRKRERYYDDD